MNHYCLMVADKIEQKKEHVKVVPRVIGMAVDPPLDEDRVYHIEEKNDRKAREKAQDILNNLETVSPDSIGNVELHKFIEHKGCSEWKKNII